MVVRIGTRFNDTMLGTDGSEIFAAGEGNDTVFAGGGNDRVSGGDGNDTLYGEAGDDTLHGNAGDDVLDGGVGNNQLFGDEGNDRFMLQLGTNAVDGGEGIDTVDYSLQAQEFHLGQPTGNGVMVDLRNGTGGFRASGDTYTGIENVVGSAFNDVIVEGGGVNVIDAGRGNDTVMSAGGLGDTLDGGTGTDWIDFSLASEATRGISGVSASLETGRLNPGAYASMRFTTLTNFENMRGSAFDDSLTGNAQANRIEGAAGNDLLRGQAGDDTLDGGTGNDTLQGGEGFDMADYSQRQSSVNVDLSAGTATLVSNGVERDTLSEIEGATGTRFNDTMTGNDSNNVLLAGDGDDTVRGGLGSDKLDGGNGVDEVSYRTSQAGVRVNLETGEASGGEAEGDGVANFENLLGSATGANQLIGSSADNRITGGNADDEIDGGKGDDIIAGGLGADILTGGVGSDSFVFNPVFGNGVSTDEIMDFEIGEDRIVFAVGRSDGKVHMEDVDGGTLVWFEDESGLRTDDVLIHGVTSAELEQNFEETFEITEVRSRVEITTGDPAQIGYDWNFG